MTPEQNERVKSLSGKQEIFDYVETHLKEQDCRSMRVFHDGVNCAYRGEDGTMCAVGCLIADDEYISGMEHHNVTELSRHLSDGTERVLPDRLLPHLRMLTELQDFHDCDSHWQSEGKGLTREGRARLRGLRSHWLGDVNPPKW